MAINIYLSTINIYNDYSLMVSEAKYKSILLIFFIIIDLF